MKKLSLNAFVLLLTLSIGLAAGTAFSAKHVDSNITAITVRPAVTSTRLEAPLPAGVHVMYAGTGFNPGEFGGWYLKFEVYNETDSAIWYSAYPGGSPFPQVTRDGKELQAYMRCGTGLVEQQIRPHTSAQFRMTYWDLNEKPKQNDIIQAGFYLGKAPGSTYEIHHSQSFTIPEEFRTAIPLNR